MLPLASPRIAVLLGAFAMLYGCDPAPPPTCAPAGQRAVVFFDRSASATGDAASAEAFSKALGDLAGRALACEGDRVDGFLLFSNTGTAYHENLEVLTKPIDLTDVAEIDREGAVASWRSAMAQEREDLAALFQKKLVEREGIPREAQQETDILGSLRVAAEAFEDAPDSTARRVLYLSDMRESTRRTRDFDIRPPANVAQAHEWAEADVTALVAAGELADRALSGVQVTVIRSTLGIGPEADAVRAYWKTAFEQLGATDVDFN